MHNTFIFDHKSSYKLFMEKEQFMSKTLKASICYMFALLAFVIIRIISIFSNFSGLIIKSTPL